MSADNGDRGPFEELGDDERSRTKAASVENEEFIEELPDRSDRRYEYRNAEGRRLFVMRRRVVDGQEVLDYSTNSRDGEHSPLSWVNDIPIERDRPLYRLQELLNADPNRRVMVFEDERLANVVARVSEKVSPVAWAGDANAWKKTDWSPVYGRPLLLVANGDEGGHDCMRALAAFLRPHCPDIKLVLPPPAKGGPGVADEARDGSPDQLPPHSSEGGNEDEWSNLIAKAKDKPGVFLRHENLDRLAALKHESHDIWINLRHRIKRECKGIRIGDLDKAIDRLTGGRERDRQGQPIEWQNPELWPEPVDGAAILDEVATIVRLYVQMPEPTADAVALWIVHTWLHDRLEISTFLNVTSATARCGKSLLMEVLGALVLRPLPVSGRITPAALFRIIERDEPTLLLDEADTYFREDPELRGIFNGSQRRDSAYVVRCVGDDHEPRNFKTWSAKAISGIGNLPDTVRDRSLVIRLDRRPPHVGDLPRWRERNRQDIEDIRKKLARLISDNANSTLARRNAVVYPPCLHDRARDAWEAPFAIADCAGGEWAAEGGRAWRAAEAISANTEDETGQREMLLADIHKVFRETGDPESLPTEFILEKLKAMDDRPWPEYRRGNPLTPRGLASLLGPFGIAPGTIRADGIATAGGTAKGYKRNAFVQVWKNYSIHDTPFPSVTPSQPLPGNEFDASTSVTISNPVTDRNS